MTANNSTNNYVIFFSISDMKIVYYNSYQFSITMPWAREEKIFCLPTYLETKSFKTVQLKFRRKFNFNSYLQMAKFIVRYTDFKPQG